MDIYGKLAVKELAELVGVDSPMISKLIKRGVVPAGVNGIDAIKALFLHYRGKGKESEDAGDVKEQQEVQKLEKLKGEARIANLKANRLSRKLVDFDLIKKDFESTAITVRDRLLNLDNKLAPLVIRCDNEGDAKRIIREEITNCLTSISQLTPEKYDGVKDDELEEADGGE